MADAHTALVREIYKACEKRADVFVWKNNTGMAKMGRRFVRFGLPGSGDLIGLTTDGTFISIEVKIPPDTQNEDQVAFEQMVCRLGGYYIIAHSVMDVIAFLDMRTYTRKGKDSVQ